jgi:hypothetical protein
VAERKHRHIIELSLSTMFHVSIPFPYWDEIFSSIVYLINRLPSYNSSIPFTTLFQKPSDFSFLRVLGCACFPYTRPYNDHKLQLRALPCVFMGYAISQKGHRCLHLATNKMYISRHVQFDEFSFPFQQNHSSTLSFGSLPHVDSPFQLLSTSPSLPSYPAQQMFTVGSILILPSNPLDVTTSAPPSASATIVSPIALVSPSASASATAHPLLQVYQRCTKTPAQLELIQTNPLPSLTSASMLNSHPHKLIPSACTSPAPTHNSPAKQNTPCISVQPPIFSHPMVT